MLTVQSISDRLAALGRREHAGSAVAAFGSRLDNLLPQQSISTWDWAVAKRKFLNADGEEVKFRAEIMPHMKGPTDACDLPGVKAVVYKGDARGGKTVFCENKVLRHWDTGPLYNVLWLMQDKDAINDYIDERGEAMLQIHEEISSKIDWTARRNSRTRKMIGRALLLYRAATPSTTRGKSAPIIIADEIDAYTKKVRDALMGLIRNRQREYGNNSLACIVSHPDAGPDGGVDKILVESLLHLWHMCCPRCGKSGSFAQEAEVRFLWNVPELIARYPDLDRKAMLEMLFNETRVLCPHKGCGATYDNDERLVLSRSGTWLQPHQTLVDGVIGGDARIDDIMGFVGHGFMSPFKTLNEMGRDWGAAKIAADLTGNIIDLKEKTVKDLGETYRTTKEEEKTEHWKVIQKRLTNIPYKLKTVPPGVDFITAFVDVQGDRFEVRVIGWSRWLESWLIDAYAIKQWPAMNGRGAFDNIDPGNRLGDWSIIEAAVLSARYPLALQPELALGIAKTAVNDSGVPGATNHGRIWLANLLTENKFQQWQVQLFHGAASKKGETYGVLKQVTRDDQNRPLSTPIYERYPNVYDVKKIILRRSKIAEPGPAAMHIPTDLSPRYVRELVSESLVNDEWIKSGANETWDGWVACDCARAWLQPDRPGLFDNRPDWATPRGIDDAGDTDTRNPLSMFDRLAAINRDTG